MRLKNCGKFSEKTKRTKKKTKKAGSMSHQPFRIKIDFLITSLYKQS